MKSGQHVGVEGLRAFGCLHHLLVATSQKVFSKLWGIIEKLLKQLISRPLDLPLAHPALGSRKSKVFKREYNLERSINLMWCEDENEKRSRMPHCKASVRRVERLCFAHALCECELHHMRRLKPQTSDGKLHRSHSKHCITIFPVVALARCARAGSFRLPNALSTSADVFTSGDADSTWRAIARKLKFDTRARRPSVNRHDSD